MKSLSNIFSSVQLFFCDDFMYEGRLKPVYRWRLFPVLISNCPLCMFIKWIVTVQYNTANLNEIVSLIRALMFAFIPILVINSSSCALPT